MARRKRKVTFRGGKYTPEEIASLTGNKLTTIKSRIKTIGWDPKYDFTEDLSKAVSVGGQLPKLYLYGGQRLPVKEIVTKSGKSNSFIYALISRLRKSTNNEIEHDLLLTIHDPEIKPMRVFFYQGERYYGSEIAKLTGIPVKSIKHHRRRGFTVEETIALEKGL